MRQGWSLIVLALALFVGLAFAASPIGKCPQLPPHNATSIFDLRVNDIKVVMSMGDSISAGFGMMGYDGWSKTFEEYRGWTAFSGGNEGEVTIANFFKHYTPDVVGASLGFHLPVLPYMDYWPELDRLNGAQSNAGVDTLDFQLEYLIRQLEANPKVNMKRDWKIVNILIGANDACPLCWDPFRPSVQGAADSYEMYMRKLLEKAYARIPRLFVNILPMFNVSQVYYITANTSYCADVHDSIPFECTCAFDSDTSNRNYLDSVLQAYDARVYKLSAEWKAKRLPEFAVQVQPYTQNLRIPSIEFLSNLDCFHPSLLANQQLAISGWNSMITPFAKKPKTFTPNPVLTCPDANTLLYAD